MIWYPDYVDDGSMFGWSYDFDEYDAEHIREYIEKNMPWFGCEAPDTYTCVPFYNPYIGEDVEIEIRLGDWFNSDELHQ